MKRYFRYFLNFSLVILLSNVALAQNNGPFSSVPAGPADGTSGNGEPDAPIDGGITLLLAAGIGYGVKRHRENRKKKTVNIQ